jgi:hypothetical protein
MTPLAEIRGSKNSILPSSTFSGVREVVRRNAASNDFGFSPGLRAIRKARPLSCQASYR